MLPLKQQLTNLLFGLIKKSVLLFEKRNYQKIDNQNDLKLQLIKIFVESLEVYNIDTQWMTLTNMLMVNI